MYLFVIVLNETVYFRIESYVGIIDKENNKCVQYIFTIYLIAVMSTDGKIAWREIIFDLLHYNGL